MFPIVAPMGCAVLSMGSRGTSHGTRHEIPWEFKSPKIIACKACFRRCCNAGMYCTSNLRVRASLDHVMHQPSSLFGGGKKRIPVQINLRHEDLRRPKSEM